MMQSQNKLHTRSLCPGGVECSVQPYVSEEMPAPIEMLFQMQHACPCSLTFSLPSTADLIDSPGSHLVHIKHFVHVPSIQLLNSLSESCLLNEKSYAEAITSVIVYLI